ncbi:hypothetical protein Scep_019480 [Stephania cephalantha]|uniref:Uncharacterized protein n=1 Tax=Stephania cephalantha TaxID=152367 RepID=A0AAP0IBV3_9MAGN
MMYAKRNGDLNMTFIKINNDDQNNNNNNNNNTEDSYTFTKNGTPIGVKKDRRKEVIAIGAAFLSNSLVVLVISVILLYKKHTTYEKILMSSGSTQEISLRSFQYAELEQATNGFKEEVGRGAFGTVFKESRPRCRRNRSDDRDLGFGREISVTESGERERSRKRRSESGETGRERPRRAESGERSDEHRATREQRTVRERAVTGERSVTGESRERSSKYRAIEARMGQDRGRYRMHLQMEETTDVS